jgi:hypothetical protein
MTACGKVCLIVFELMKWLARGYCDKYDVLSAGYGG